MAEVDPSPCQILFKFAPQLRPQVPLLRGAALPAPGAASGLPESLPQAFRLPSQYE